uniref:Uncharacterized protein n=1 Tax=Trypanosoma congolense (strain IL3000) TaxID=1068625 RepID=G0UJS8_TRYCI|nr:conserved hypothetical protein [Trypanosoma congolense IL3000]
MADEKSPTSPPAKDGVEEMTEVPAVPPVTISSAVPYTEEEKNLLLEHLRGVSHHQERSEKEEGVDGSWREGTLPLLCSMVEKVLSLAAERCNVCTDAGGTEGGETKAKEGDQSSQGTPVRDVTINMDLFKEESDYILEQLRLQPWPFFTLPRLYEILADPFKYNCHESELRGEKLQSAIRRCVLVSCPLNSGSRSNSLP